MIFVVFLGYIGYLRSDITASIHLAELATPMVFFLGACIVLIVCTMSLETAHDVRRIAILEIENITDALVDVFNRRYFDKRLVREVARAQRHGVPVSLLLIDHDHFKDVNDRWCHQTGDTALIAVGNICNRTIRAQDVVARYGGEEFAVIAPDSDIASAEALAERLRKSIVDTPAVPADESVNRNALHLTASIGVATLKPGETDADLIARTDAALYKSKDTGRNRVVVSYDVAV